MAGPNAAHAETTPKPSAQGLQELKAHHGVGEMPLFAKADFEADGGKGTGQFAPLIGSPESISRTISTWPKSITTTPGIAETQWVSLLMTKHLLSNCYFASFASVPVKQIVVSICFFYHLKGLRRIRKRGLHC